MPRRSSTVRPTRSITPSWRRPRRPSWCRSMPAGAMSAPGRRFMRRATSLSLQLHHHRAEHWIVVSGTARITRGEEVFLLEENQSTYIPIGVKHRIENPGKIPLHIIEVQSGSYFGEDDIVRLEDRYGRQGTTT